MHRAALMAGGGARFIHATALVIGEAGVLLRGPSGSGKSSLALSLIREAGREGLFARLVGDDRVSIEARNGAVIARPHPALQGLLERRTLPIAAVAYERACVVKLVVDLMETPPRLPDPECHAAATLDGVELPLLQLDARNADHSGRLVLQHFASR